MESLLKYKAILELTDLQYYHPHSSHPSPFICSPSPWQLLTITRHAVSHIMKQNVRSIAGAFKRGVTNISHFAIETNVCDENLRKEKIPPSVYVHHEGMMAERVGGGFGLECVNCYTPRVPKASLQRFPSCNGDHKEHNKGREDFRLMFLPGFERILGQCPFRFRCAKEFLSR